MIARLVALFEKAFEKLTGYLTVIESDHAYIHKKRGFVVTGSTTIASAGTYKIQFKTPDPADPAIAATEQEYIHWRPSMIYGLAGGITWQLFESSTGITPGTSVTPINLNRNTPRLSNMSINIGATVTGNGTAIQTAGSGTAGNPAQGAGGGSGADRERVLKANTDYTLVITNQFAGDNLTVYELFWYEEDTFKG